LLPRLGLQAGNTLSFGIVVQLDLAYAEPVGLRIAGVLSDLRDGLGGQLQILVKAMNRAMSCPCRP
jgi:hypothetical protein